MEPTLEDRIRLRAYFLWLDNGQQGEATHFWLIAERDVRAEVAIESGTEPEGTAALARDAGSAALRAVRRVNALVLLNSGADRDQADLSSAAE